MLKNHGLPPLDESILQSPPAAQNIQFVIGELKRCSDQEQDTEEDQEKKSIGRERLRRILRGVEKYTKIVDTAVQHSPEVTALVWAGIRGILQVRIHAGCILWIVSKFLISGARFLSIT